MPTIAIIGAGFSGTLLAVHLLRQSQPGTVIKLIERKRPFGLGMAYATGNPSHLLNVRAGGMSAFRDQPDHFVEWLNATPSRWGAPAASRTSFVPRREFGTYVRALLDHALEHDETGPVLDLVPGDVVDLALADTARRGGAGSIHGRAMLTLAEGRRIGADLVVLATGNVPALPPPARGGSFYDSALYRADPWAEDALAGLDPDAPVVLIGSGLTAMDVTMSLLDRGHRGAIQLLSRRGQLPQPHLPGIAPAEQRTAYPSNPLALLRHLRAEVVQAARDGVDWRAVVDAMRPFTSDIWQLMPIAERARFLRHLRPYWDTHRHRMAPAIAARLAAARATGQFSVRAGRIAEYVQHGASVSIRYRARQGGGVAELQAARVINCSGPAADYERIPDPLLRALLANGIARPDALKLGLDVTANCALRGRTGAVSRQVFAIGPLTRPTFWEIMAVPDIRRQCEVIAAHLAGLLPGESIEGRVPQPEMFVI